MRLVRYGGITIVFGMVLFFVTAIFEPNGSDTADQIISTDATVEPVEEAASTTTSLTNVEAAEAQPVVLDAAAEAAAERQTFVGPTKDVPTYDQGDWPTFDQMNPGDYFGNQAKVTGDGQAGSVRFTCMVSHFGYDDPIVAPNEPGFGHLHMFFGNTLTDAYSTTESLENTGDGTCNGGPLNRSAYWIPAMIDADGNARVAQYSLIYYKAGPLHGQQINEIPNGLKMIAGNALATSPSENDAKYEWRCGFPGNYPLQYGKGGVIPDCSPGDALSLSLVFPQCWDGINLDSDDHKSHMAYPQGNSCPASHPVAVPEITYNIFWNNSDQNTASWYLSSDRFNGHNAEDGATAHGDWFGAWHPEIRKAMSEYCHNRGHDCKGSTISESHNLASSSAPNLVNGYAENPGMIFDPYATPTAISVDSIPLCRSEFC